MAATNPDDKRPRLPTLFLIGTLVGLGVSLWRPIYPQEQSLQHIPTAAALGLLAWGIRRRLFSTIGFACLFAILGLHILGARYIYSYTPYDDWFRALFASAPSDWFGWSRNHYDRFVHFAFGLLFVRPASELACRAGRLPPAWGVAFGLLCVMAVSLIYEVAEWLLTLLVSPLHAEAYNGQQGDFWDAQKDMALATAGGLIAYLLIAAGRRRIPDCAGKSS